MPKAPKLKILPPIQQPGGEVLSEISRVVTRWTRGDVCSDKALCSIGEIVSDSEWFEGLLKSSGRKKK